MIEIPSDIRTITVREKNPKNPFRDTVRIFKFDGRNQSQVAFLEQCGAVCYNQCLLMNQHIRDSRIALNGYWVIQEGEGIAIIPNVDTQYEPMLKRYGADDRTIEQVWRYNNGT